jgi:hypothetical protein
MAYDPINFGQNNNGSKEPLATSLRKIDKMFEEIYAGGIGGVDIDLSAVNQNIIPSDDINYDLGSSSNRWRELHVGPGSIYLGTLRLVDQGGFLAVGVGDNPPEPIYGPTGPTGPSGVFGVILDSFVGDNSTTEFTLSIDPGNENNVLVYIKDGINRAVLSKTEYSVTGDILTFNSPPPFDSLIEVSIFQGGSIGPTGSTGPSGPTGSTGPSGPTGPQGALTQWSVKTSNYQAVDGDRIIADTSGGTFTVDLPPTPSAGNYVQITDGSNFDFINLTVGRNGSTIEDFEDDVLLTLPGCTFEFIYNGSTWEVTATTGARGPTGPSGFGSPRTTVSESTGTLADGATADITITGFKGYVLYKIETSAAAWVTIYTNAASRSADSERPEGVDPSPGAGVIAEVITSGSELVPITPAVVGFNDESPPTSNIELTVTNKSGISADITVTLTVLEIEN